MKENDKHKPQKDYSVGKELRGNGMMGDHINSYEQLVTPYILHCIWWALSCI